MSEMTQEQAVTTLKRAASEWRYADEHDNELPAGVEPVSCDEAARAFAVLLAAYEERGLEALRFYRADGSFEILGSAAEVIEHRKACAKELVERWHALDAMRGRAEATESKLAEKERDLEQAVLEASNRDAWLQQSEGIIAGLRQQLEAAQARLSAALHCINNHTHLEEADCPHAAQARENAHER